MKKILVLGCTGSIGTSGLSIARSLKDRFQVVGLSANKNAEKLIELGKEFCCENLCLTSSDIDSDNIKYKGTEGLKNLIRNSDASLVLNGIAGASGLMPSVETLNSGKNLALANKETIVMAGKLIKMLACNKGLKILPVDSEHSAVFNLIEKIGSDNVESIVLTASGGPFRNMSKDELKNVTLKDALKHPTWSMGQKITVDSASLANKGLEVIEACYLFNVEPSKVKVVVHPQSLIHSLVRTKDGVLYAQISKPDMRHPILSALAWPEFVENNLEPLNLAEIMQMSFFEPRIDDFRMLKLAYEAVSKKGSYTIAYNAANEVAVEAFIKNQISFMDIPVITEETLLNDWSKEPLSFEEVYEYDKLARKAAFDILKQL